MERSEEALRERVRETPLSERLKTCEKYVASMCAERRPPKMTIPLQHYDEDFYIYTTLADAQATIAALQARVQELEEITKVICGHCCEPMEIPSKAVLQSALTQRTAELEAANKHCEIIEERKAEAYKEVEIQLLAKANLRAELERVRGLVRALPAYKDISVSHRIDENDYESWHVWVDHNPLAECDTEEEANAIKALYEHRQGMEG